MYMAKQNFIIIAAAVLLLLAVGAWYWATYTSQPIAELEVAAPVAPLGAELLEKTQNPLKDELPSTNPFKQAETNPFVDVYKNPFAP